MTKRKPTKKNEDTTAGVAVVIIIILVVLCIYCKELLYYYIFCFVVIVLFYLIKFIKKAKKRNSGPPMDRVISIECRETERLKKSFISIDVETTGLDRESDRIIEIAAVRFKDGKEVESFSTLVRSVCKVPYEASQINHITGEMLRDRGIPEDKAIEKFIDFIHQNTVDDKSILVAYNASFDISFIVNTIIRINPSSNITLYYYDVLKEAKNIPFLDSYSQKSVADYLGIEYRGLHRAKSDARVCGEILLTLFKNDEEWQKRKKEIEKRKAIISEKRKPDDRQLEICAYILKLLKESGKDYHHVTFFKQVSGKVRAEYIDEFMSFRFRENGSLTITLLRIKNCELAHKTHVASNGEKYEMVCVNNWQDLSGLAESILNSFQEVKEKPTPWWIDNLDSECKRRIKNDDRFVIDDESINKLSQSAAHRFTLKAENEEPHSSEEIQRRRT